jgi:hypothetical protein
MQRGIAAMDIGKLQPSMPPLADEPVMSTPPRPAVARESTDLGKIPDLPPDTITDGPAQFPGQSALGGLDLGFCHPALELPPRPDPGSAEAGGKSSGMISDLTGANQLGVVVEDHPQAVFSPTPEPAGHPDPGALEAGSKSSGMSSDLTGANQFGVVVED